MLDDERHPDDEGDDDDGDNADRDQVTVNVAVVAGDVMFAVMNSGPAGGSARGGRCERRRGGRLINGGRGWPWEGGSGGEAPAGASWLAGSHCLRS